MARHFFKARPIQASKLPTIVATGLFAIGGVYGILPNQGFNGLLLVVILRFGLTAVITVDTLFLSYLTQGESPAVHGEEDVITIPLGLL